MYVGALKIPAGRITVIYSRRSGMKKGFIEEGWQRFLDRLKELWGKSRNPAPMTGMSWTS